MRKILTHILPLLFAAAQAQNIKINVTAGPVSVNISASPINILAVTPPASPDRYYMAHVMNTFTGKADNLHVWIDSMKNVDGYNLLWLFGDNYYYDKHNVEDPDNRLALNFLDSAAVVGMPVLVGNQSGADTVFDRLMLQETWDHPATFKYKGNPTYLGYAYGGQLPNILTAVAPLGYSKSQFNYWVYWGNFPVTVAGTTYYLPTPQKTQDVLDQYLRDTLVDGLVNFAVDKPNGGGALQNIKDENKFVAKGSAIAGKVAIAGINHNYSSAQYVSYGFSGTLSQVKEILAIRPLTDWPIGICESTANDYVEGSSMSRTLVQVVNGLAFMPSMDQGYNLGDNTPYPIIDGSGIQKFIRPWIEKFKHTDTTPVTFSTDEIFYWYVPHRKDAPFITTVPDFYVDARPSTVNGVSLQSWWDMTRYHGPRAGVPADTNLEQHKRIVGIKTYQDTNYYHIRMAAHLRAPAYLEIEVGGTTYRSTLQSGPDGYFEIPFVNNVTPIFRVVDVNTSVRKTHTAYWDIKDGNMKFFGWQPLIQKAP